MLVAGEIPPSGAKPGPNGKSNARFMSASTVKAIIFSPEEIYVQKIAATVMFIDRGAKKGVPICPTSAVSLRRQQACSGRSAVSCASPISRNIQISAAWRSTTMTANSEHPDTAFLWHRQAPSALPA